MDFAKFPMQLVQDNSQYVSNISSPTFLLPVNVSLFAPIQPLKWRVNKLTESRINVWSIPLYEYSMNFG